MSVTGYPFEIPIEVIFRDLDVLGHVNNAVYLTYMETARTKFFVELLTLDGPDKLPVILAEASCSFLAPAFFGQQLRVGVGVSRFGTKSFDLAYRITTADGKPVATAKTVMVMYDYKTEKTCPITDDFKQRIRDFQGDWQLPPAPTSAPNTKGASS